MKEKENIGFIPNIFADVKYIMLDLFDEGKNEVSTTDVYDMLRESFTDADFTRSDINDILCTLCKNGDIVQVKTDKAEYIWKKPDSKETKKESKKSSKKNAKAKAQEEEVEEDGGCLQYATKHKAETDKGDVIFYTIDPSKFDEKTAKGFWVATSDEAMDIYLFENTLTKKEVVALVMQLVDMEDEEGIEVKKNF